jgi:hypothetical protein
VEQAGDLTAECVLLPKDYWFKEALAGTPEFCRQWIGLWQGGSWDRKWPAALIVSEITSVDETKGSCQARVTVAWGKYAPLPFSWENNAPSYKYATATITAAALKVNGSIFGDLHTYRFVDLSSDAEIRAYWDEQVQHFFSKENARKAQLSPDAGWLL